MISHDCTADQSYEYLDVTIFFGQVVEAIYAKGCLIMSSLVKDTDQY